MTEIEEIKEKITPILEKYGVKRAGVFGSVARGEARLDSDVDILFLRGDKIFSLFDLFDFQDELKKALGRKVDVVSEGAIVPYFRESIFADLKPIYEKR